MSDEERLARNILEPISLSFGPKAEQRTHAMKNAEIKVFENLQQVAQAAAEEFIRQSQKAIQQNNRFTVALSGGSTPKALYGLLAKHTAEKSSPAIDWSRIHLFFGDERHVPPDHPDSNFRMANENLISKVPIPAANVHRVRAENPDAAQAAADYDKDLVASFQLTGSQLPRFDLILLGMGPDGHTASLFPGTAAVQDLVRRVVANWVPKFNTWRITFTRPVLNNAACVLLMVCGADKAAAVKAVMGDGSPDTYPVKYVSPRSGELIWMLDKAAAAQI
jgi:6-phosphogluconolactonase